MNNAGFDIISQASYSTFRNGIWTILLYISSVQIIIGGIGYIVGIFGLWALVRASKMTRASQSKER